MAKLTLLMLFGASVLAGKPPETASKAVNGSHSNFTYGYSLQGKNDAHQEQIQHRVGKHVEGSFAVHLPDGQSVSDVEYTADERGFHPIVRLSTKTNHSQVTSHFALGQSAVKRLSEQNEKNFESTAGSKDSPSVTALISQYEGKPLDAFEMKKNTDQKPSIKYDSKNVDDTISQVLTSLFPDGIPKKYEELLNTTNDSSFEIKTDYPIPTTYASRKTKEENITSTPFIIPTEDTKVRRGLSKEEYKDSTRFLRKQKSFQHLVSDEEVLQINDAAENYTEEDAVGTQIVPPVEQVPVHEYETEDQRGGFTDLHPFKSPIIVEEQNDNLFASGSGNAQNYIAPNSKEIRIFPGRERYVSSRNYDPERRINFKIMDGGHGFKQALLKAASAQDLDTFQKIVEESFSNSPEYQTEAPSRAFLRELDQKNVKYNTPPFEKEGRYKSSDIKYPNQENIQQIEDAAQRLLDKYEKERRYEDTRGDSDEKNRNRQGYEELKTRLVQKYENKPNAHTSTAIRPPSGDISIESRSEKGNTVRVEELRQIPRQLFTTHRTHSNEEDNIDLDSSPPKSSTSERPREKTFVEIAKAVNIQNLLIKEDEDSIERHEEYLQPLAFGDRLTHRIESKFMKAKPWDHYPQNSVSENQYTLIPVTIRPSISYTLPPEHIEYHPPEYHNFQQYDSVQPNPEDHHLIQQHPPEYQQEVQDQQHIEDPNQNFSEDPEEKDVEESRHVSKLPTRVNYNDIETYPQKVKSESNDLRQSVATPVVAKYFPKPSPIVEKIVEKQVKVPFPVKEYVEKIIEKPVHVEKIINRPVPVPYLVAVDRIVETPVHVPYPVEHLIAVEKLVETEVPIEVEKFVDRPVPFPVEKIINRPYPVEKIVEKVVNRPVPIHIPIRVPVPVHIPVKISIPNSYLTSSSTTTAVSQQPYIDLGKKDDLQEVQKAFDSVYSQPLIIQQQITDDVKPMLQKQPLWPNKQMLMNRNPKQISESEFQNMGNVKDDYYGPVPLQSEYSHWGGQNFKRSSDFGRNLRMEYGFKPPLIPSVEIDDQGIPVNRKNDS